ncbi:halo transducer protein [Halorussus litoreus]|uniref:halo transducer protein n=1 Tax=Halorussus litoreus TaxID=1710536 RepID=UPI000E22170E|nr:halo transducer protein [Halorussus litoreus]
MTRDDASDSILGRPVEDAVQAVLDRRAENPADAPVPVAADAPDSASTDAPESAATNPLDPDEVRATLDRVASDGVVTRDAVEEALTETSMVVSTAETRTELASHALADAREAAASVSDLDAVAARLDAFESRLAAVEDRASALGSDLEALVEKTGDPDSVYEVAVGTRRLRATAKRVQRDADALQMDLESFEEWLDSPETRFEEFGEDIDAVECSLDGLATTLDEMPTAPRGDAANSDAVDPDADSTGVDWAVARLRHRVLGLLLADLRAELADLRTWAERAARDDNRAADPAGGRMDGLEEMDDLEARLDALGARRSGLGDRLDDLARPAWSARFGDRVASFEAETADLDPPLDWSAVESAFEEHRPADRLEAVSDEVPTETESA